jgi:hypothetical protein
MHKHRVHGIMADLESIDDWGPKGRGGKLPHFCPSHTSSTFAAQRTYHLNYFIGDSFQAKSDNKHKDGVPLKYTGRAMVTYTKSFRPAPQTISASYETGIAQPLARYHSSSIARS